MHTLRSDSHKHRIDFFKWRCTEMPAKGKLSEVFGRKTPPNRQAIPHASISGNGGFDLSIFVSDEQRYSSVVLQRSERLPDNSEGAPRGVLYSATDACTMETGGLYHCRTAYGVGIEHFLVDEACFWRSVCRFRPRTELPFLFRCFLMKRSR